jgi:hypothetical protein
MHPNGARKAPFGVLIESVDFSRLLEQPGKGRTMTRALKCLLVLSCLVLGSTGCQKVETLFKEDPSIRAKARVSFILETIKQEGSSTSTKLQTAICRWEEDEVLLSNRDQLGAVSDAFDVWRGEGKIYPTLTTFELGEQTHLAGPNDPQGTVYISAKIDGNWHWLRVPPKARISWADS